MKKSLLWFAAAIWLAFISTGLGMLLIYSNTAGAPSSVPGRWPRQSKIPEDRGQPMLILFAHPKCPCTRASIGELALLMAHCQNRVNARVVFFRPKGGGADWMQTDLWRSAEMIPGVAVQGDEEGNEARCFQVTTSGSVVLYDVGGKLLFDGGITASRGHSGDNAGRSAIMELLSHETPTGAETPVFGCSLFNSKDGVCRR